MKIKFKKLTKSNAETVQAFSLWGNDIRLTPLLRPNKSQEDIEKQKIFNKDELAQRLEHCQIYLIYLDGQLIGEMNYQVGFEHLYKDKPTTAWVGIGIGEESARGKGIGFLAMQYLEKQIKKQGLKRIELGVFEFNTNALKLYQKLDYKEINRIKDFTYWNGRMWQEIRMEKYL
jgi:RimJ/RimL family protein N-acetyltransferase